MNFIKTFEQVDSTNSLSKEQIDFLNRYVSGSWDLVNGFVNIDGHFHTHLTGKEWQEKDFRGIRFGKISGHFNCSNNLLTSLEGCPQEVGESFDCSKNLLTSLKGGPRLVSKGFYCSDNKLTSLAGSPQEVGGSFLCGGNNLISLEGGPQKVGGDFSSMFNELTSLLGGPREVRGDVEFRDNRLVSLRGFPQKAGGDFTGKNNLVSEETLQLLWNKLKEIPIYSIALASIWSKIPEKEQELMKKDLDPDYLDYSQLGDFGLI